MNNNVTSLGPSRISVCRARGRRWLGSLTVGLAIFSSAKVVCLASKGWSGSQILIVDSQHAVATQVSSQHGDRNWTPSYVSWWPEGCSPTNACGIEPGARLSYASGEIYAAANYGNLHGFVTATAFNNGPATGAPPPGPTVTTVVSHGDVNASYTDQLVIRGTNSLSPGSPVQIQFQLNLEVNFASERYGGGVGEDNHVSTELDVLDVDNTILDARSLTSSYVSGVYTNNQTASITRNASVGDTIGIRQTLAVRSWVSAPNVGAYAYRKVNALNTARLWVQILTPGAYFESQSGSKYQDVTPGQARVAINKLPTGLIELSWPVEPQLPLMSWPALGADPLPAIGAPTTQLRNGTNYNVLTVSPTNLQSFFYLGAPGN